MASEVVAAPFSHMRCLHLHMGFTFPTETLTDMQNETWTLL